MEINIREPAEELIPINTTLGNFVGQVISAVILVAGLATFLYLIYGGVSWILSGGEKGKIQEARDRITNAIVGLAIVASSYAIYWIIDYFFGIGIITGN